MDHVVLPWRVSVGFVLAFAFSGAACGLGMLGAGLQGVIGCRKV